MNTLYSYTGKSTKWARTGGLGVRTAKGDFTERAAARVQTSRGTAKMQPKTSHRATTLQPAVGLAKA